MAFPDGRRYDVRRIKERDMSGDLYGDILKRASQLSAEDLLRLSEELSQRAGRKNGRSEHRILDLEGLGKEVWKGVDPDQYVAKERESWDG